MSEDKVNVPKIRFPGFTDAWEQRKLGELTERVRGNDGRMDLPTLTISAGNGWLDQRERFSGNIAGSEQKNYTLLTKGELSYNHGNSKLAKYGAVFVLRTYEEALVPRVYHSFKTTKDTSADFIEYLFSTKIPDRELAKLISSGARMDGLLNINYDEFMNIKVTVPKVEEQIKIAEFLRVLDDLITLHQRKLNNVKNLKAGLLQKMFPKDDEDFPEIRFPGFTDAWEQRKVIDIAPLQRGFDLPVSEIEAGSYPVIMSNGIGAYHSKYKVKAPGVVTGRSGTIGNLTFVEVDYWPHNTALWVTDFKGNDAKFIYFLYQKLDLKRYGTGSGVPTLNRNDVHDTTTSIPSVAEQKHISLLFDSLDHLITLHQRKLEHLQEQKKALLQQMFV
ncbi:restriction endonuclease subunit S [Paenibacillus apis]|uniref:Restriction endonuclease subunit S n=1 Tax=Paenibacillus apis TaxID=1792174 RepID=A0A919Y6R7_9BACL|nr:restriction endonuclease subunit S [Paenibacillus apis]GIO43132.1 restriction endonuclease subunit S [Paenibacillus apis]